MTHELTHLWRSADDGRFFIVPEVAALRLGPMAVHDGAGQVRLVEAHDLEPYEVSEDQAHRWTRDQLGRTLDELRASLNDTIANARARLDEERHTPVAPDTTLTPNAVPALLDLLRSLPRIVGQSISGDEERVAAARSSLTVLQQRLAEGGVALDERFTGFADRLAGLREEMESRRAPPPAPNADAQPADDSSRDTSANPEPGSNP